MSEFAKTSPETLAFLLSRRSHPSTTMTGPGPGEDELRKILTAAARVPDHGKLAPWRFIVYRETDGARIGQELLRLAEEKEGPLDPQRKAQELERFSRAPLVVGVISKAAVHPKIPVWEQELSAGAVCMTLLTAASASGYAAQWLTEWYSFDDAAARFLGAQEGERFAGFVHIGTPSQAPFERGRPDMDSVISEWSEQ